MDGSSPVATPQLSPDGHWWWDGQQWLPAAAVNQAGRPVEQPFDAQVWAQQVLPHSPGASGSAGSHPSSAAHWMLPLGRSWQAITAGYLGLLSIFLVFLGPFALATGVAGLRVAAKQGSHGRGRCTFGIIGGLWGTLWTIVIIGSLAGGN
jgi:hypothetical protein